MPVKKPAVATGQSDALSRYQKLVIFLLSITQFTVVVDFMIISPLGVLILSDLQISAAQFGITVSAYAVCAGIAAILAANFVDRFDRKKTLVFLYAGFLIGTFLCGLAPNFYLLVLARAITGVFGGVIGSVVLAIAADLFSYEKRGLAIGYVQSAFSSSQIFGIPLGIFLSELYGWRFTFFMLVVIGFGVLCLIVWKMQPVDQHLKTQNKAAIKNNFGKVVLNKGYALSFITSALVVTGGFMIMPFASTFNVYNLGIPLSSLPIVFVFSGVAAFIAGPLTGNLSDRYGKFPLFIFGALLTILAILIFTHMKTATLFELSLILSVLFVGVTSRIVSSQALSSALPQPAERGAFMSVTSAVQMLAGGLASLIAGYIVTLEPDGSVSNYDVIGYVVTCTVLATIVGTYVIHRIVQKKIATA